MCDTPPAWTGHWLAVAAAAAAAVAAVAAAAVVVILLLKPRRHVRHVRDPANLDRALVYLYNH